MKVPRHLPAIPIIIVASLSLAVCGDAKDKPATTTTDPMMTETTHPMMTGTTDPMMNHSTTTTGG